MYAALSHFQTCSATVPLQCRELMSPGRCGDGCGTGPNSLPGLLVHEALAAQCAADRDVAGSSQARKGGSWVRPPRCAAHGLCCVVNINMFIAHFIFSYKSLQVKKHAYRVSRSSQACLLCVSGDLFGESLSHKGQSSLRFMVADSHTECCTYWSPQKGPTCIGAGCCTFVRRGVSALSL